MKTKHKDLLKKIGIAGFLFFLVKGIIWLLLGSAFYKWLKELVIINLFSLIPFMLNAQSLNYSVDSLKMITANYFQLHKPILSLNNTIEKPFFCKLEDQLNHNKKTYLKFRLGSMEYSNQLEYAKYLYNGKLEP